MPTKQIEGVGECLIFPTDFIEKIMEVIVTNQDDDDFYFKTKLKPFQEGIVKRGIWYEGDKSYCCLTKREFSKLKKRFEDAQTKAQHIF